MNRTLLDTDIYSEILRAVNPTVIAHARASRTRYYPIVRDKFPVPD